jgi:hypothetical protein
VKLCFLFDIMGHVDAGDGCSCLNRRARITDVSLVIDDLQQQQTRQVGAAAPAGFIFSGALRVPSLDVRGENPRFGLYWLYLAIPNVSLLKELCGEPGFSPEWKPTISD